MMRRTTLLILLLAGALGVALFAVKYEVQDLEQELIDLNRAMIADRQAIHVLKAEWSHLNNPHRLRVLARRHLGMAPVEPAQLGTLAELPERRRGSEGAWAAPPAGGRRGPGFRASAKSEDNR